MSAIGTGGKLAPAQETETALKTLPVEFQKPVGWFYGFFREGLKGSASLAMRIRWWIETEGLTLDEARQAMKSLMSPQRAGEITYGGNQLLAVLAQEVGAIVAERKKRQLAEEQRKEAEATRLRIEANPPSDADRQKVREMLSTWKGSGAEW